MKSALEGEKMHDLSKLIVESTLIKIHLSQSEIVSNSTHTDMSHTNSNTLSVTKTN